MTKAFKVFLKNYGLRSPFMLRPDVKHREIASYFSWSWPLVMRFGVIKGVSFRLALPSIEICFVLAGILFVGPGQYSVDKT